MVMDTGEVFRDDPLKTYQWMQTTEHQLKTNSLSASTPNLHIVPTTIIGTCNEVRNRTKLGI